MNDKIIVEPTAVQAVLASAVRILILLVGGVTTVFGLLKRADLEGFYAYVQSAEGLTFIGAIVTAGTVGYSLYTRARSHQRLVTAADAAPNSVAEVKR